MPEPVTGVPGGGKKTLRYLTQLAKEGFAYMMGKKKKKRKKPGPGDIELSSEHPTGRAIKGYRAEQKRQIEGAFK